MLYTDLGVPAIENLLKTHDKKQPLALVVAAHSPHVYWLENQGYDPASFTVPPYLVDTPITRNAMARYYTDVSQADKEVGQVRAALDRYGFGKNTLFMFTSDQGPQFPFGKWSLYEAGMRVPFIAAWPGKIARNATNDAIVSLVDVLPTVIEAAGGTAPNNIDGRSFVDVLEGRSTHHLDAAFAAHTGDGQMNRAPMRAIRTERLQVHRQPGAGDSVRQPHQQRGGQGRPRLLGQLGRVLRPIRRPLASSSASASILRRSCTISRTIPSSSPISRTMRTTLTRGWSCAASSIPGAYSRRTFGFRADAGRRPAR